MGTVSPATIYKWKQSDDVPYIVDHFLIALYRLGWKDESGKALWKTDDARNWFEFFDTLDAYNKMIEKGWIRD